MEKDVSFYFKNGVEQKLECILVNDEKVSLNRDRNPDACRIINLKSRKNNITLVFKEGEKFSTPLLGGEWDKIIINKTRERKLNNRVLLGIALGCIFAFILDIIVIKNQGIRTHLLTVATVTLWGYYISKKNKYSVIFR